MENQQANDQKGRSADFLLTEYQRLMDSFWRTEELGERRVNFFITLTAAVIAGLTTISVRGISVSDAKVDSIFFYALGALLLIGVVTLVRMVRRNLESHKYLRATGRIRKYFTERDKLIELHLYFEPRDDKPVRKKEWKEIFFLGTGGLVETVALVNGLIVAALCALFTVRSSRSDIMLLGFVGFIAAWIVQFIYVKARYYMGRPKEDEIKFRGD